MYFPSFDKNARMIGILGPRSVGFFAVANNQPMIDADQCSNKPRPCHEVARVGVPEQENGARDAGRIDVRQYKVIAKVGRHEY